MDHHHTKKNERQDNNLFKHRPIILPEYSINCKLRQINSFISFTISMICVLAFCDESFISLHYKRGQRTEIPQILESIYDMDYNGIPSIIMITFIVCNINIRTLPIMPYNESLNASRFQMLSEQNILKVINRSKVRNPEHLRSIASRIP